MLLHGIVAEFCRRDAPSLCALKSVEANLFQGTSDHLHIILLISIYSHFFVFYSYNSLNIAMPSKSFPPPFSRPSDLSVC